MHNSSTEICSSGSVNSQAESALPVLKEKKLLLIVDGRIFDIHDLYCAMTLAGMFPMQVPSLACFIDLAVSQIIDQT